MARYERKQGDTATISETLQRPDGSNALDLSNADSVKIYMDHPGSDTLVVNDQVSFVNDGSDGKVEYDLASDQTTREGRHRIEFLASYPNGTQISYPASGFIILDLERPVDRDLPVEEADDPDLSLTTLYADELAANTGSEIGVSSPLDLKTNPLHRQGIRTVQSRSDFVDGEPGFYEITGTGEVVYFDGDTSTN